MFIDSDLQDLTTFVSPTPVLSVYCDTEPGQRNSESFKLHLRSMLKKIDLSKDVTEVERYFNHEYDWNGKSAVVFSSFPQQFFRVYNLAIPIGSFAIVSDRPAVRPLASVLERYGSYGIALIDKQRARMIHLHLGEILTEEQFNGQEIKHTKRGGASAVTGMRGGIAGQKDSTAETTNQNLKAASEVAAAFFEREHVRRILLGGTNEVVSQFRSLLPKAWQSLIVQTFAMEMTINSTDLVEKANAVIKTASEKQAEFLVRILLDAAAKGQGAVLGMKDTLAAVSDNKVRTLIVLDGLHLSGQHCKSCGLLTTRAVHRCPNCNQLLSNQPDLIELAVSETLRKGGTVQPIPASPTLEKAGSIGALLRY
jgi:peptide chain release factor subunit 1